MQFPMSHTRPSTRPVRNPRRRGSVLILVSAVLVIAVMIGTAFIASARFDRAATRELNRNNGQQVANVALDAVLRELRRDVLGTVNDDAKFLSSEEHPEMGSGFWLDEPYDYPGKHDLWLAAHAPSDANDTWTQVSNVFPDADGDDFVAGDADLGGDSLTPVDVAGLDPNILTDDRADADGDGITDSRWAPAPVGHIGGLNYVVAIRVVDLSGLPNVNVHLGPAAGSDHKTFASGVSSSPRWRYPSEWNLLGWASRAASGYDKAEMDEFIEERLNKTPALTWQDHENFWVDGVMRGFTQDNAFETFGHYGNELELRFRNGLNSVNASSELDEHLTMLMREDSRDDEYAEGDFTGTPFGSDPLQYLRNEPRHRMTTLSGAVPVPVLVLPGDDEMSERVKADLNSILDGNDQSQFIDDIRDLLVEGDGYTLPPTLPVGGKRYAAQLLACWADYADSDNLVSVVDENANQTYYGLEALPFITEVYRHRMYSIDWQQADPNSPWKAYWKQDGDTGYAIELRNPFAGNDAIIWNDEFTTKLRVRVDGKSGETEIALRDHVPSGDRALKPGQAIVLYHDAGSGDQVKQTIESDGPEPVDLGKIDQFEATEDESNTVFVELLAETEDGDFIVYQKALSDAISDGALAGTQIGEDVPAGDTPDSGDTEDALEDEYGESSASEPGHKKIANFGNGNGINAMLMTSEDFDLFAEQVRFNDLPLPEGVSDPNSGNDATEEIDLLGEADKTAKAVFNYLDPNQYQARIANYPDGKLRSIGELATVMILGPRPEGNDGEQTVAERWRLDTDLDDPQTANMDAVLLDPNGDELAGDSDGPDAVQLPYGTLLFDRYTVNRNDKDDLDNNANDVTDELAEALVPGVVNLNTITERDLRELLPIDDENVREDLAGLIVAYRERASYSDSDATGGDKSRNFSGQRVPGISGWRTDKGLASIYEAYTATRHLLVDGEDTRTLGGLTIDFDGLGTDDPNTDEDGIADDREEQAMALQWLSNIATTRSDLFAIYITVRGYDAGVWDEPREQIRLVALVDRSTLFHDDAAEREVKVLAVMQY